MTGAEYHLTAVVLAGHSLRETDLLADATHGGPKALIPIGGKPMVQWVVDALCGSGYLQRVVVAGLQKPSLAPCRLPLEFAPPLEGGLVDNARAGLRYVLERWPDTAAVVFAASDIPMLTPQAVDDFIAQCLQSEHDFYYSIIARPDMERRFPTSRRTYARLREGAFCGGDVTMVRPAMLEANLDLLNAAAGQRKSVWKEMRLLGLDNLALFAAGQLSLRRAEAQASKVLGLRARAVVSHYPELGMDVDKPHQLDIARAELER